MEDLAKIPGGALVAAALAAAPAAEPEDPNAGVSTAVADCAAGTSSSAMSAAHESGASTTVTSSAADMPLHTRVAAHLESIFQMAWDQHKAIADLVQRIEAGEQTVAHEIAAELRKLIALP
jgi:cation transport regulator ChaB